jgi:hypothetical protein
VCWSVGGDGYRMLVGSAGTALLWTAAPLAGSLMGSSAWLALRTAPAAVHPNAKAAVLITL